MGKASRKKKERKDQNLAGIVQSQMDGVASGEEQARQMYWDIVCVSIEKRGAECLPEMVALGRTMRQSIFDVKVWIKDRESGEVSFQDILSATFMSKKVDCFEWLLDESRRTCTAGGLVGRLFMKIVEGSAQLKEETPQMAMAKMLGRFVAEIMHVGGSLHDNMSEVDSVMSSPFARRMGQDYLEEVAAAKERAELASVVADPFSDAEPSPHAVEAADAVVSAVREGSRSLRI